MVIGKMTVTGYAAADPLPRADCAIMAAWMKIGVDHG
jgi:hypothetical protein